jgi:hypothetical protein
VRNDRLNDSVRATSLEKGYVRSRFRESRDRNYAPTFLAGSDRLEAIRGMPVHQRRYDQIEVL